LFDRQQMLFTILCAAFEKLSKNLSKALIEEATSLGIDDGSYFVFGEAAVNYYSQVARGCDEDSRGRTTIMDVAIQNPDVIAPLTRRITTVLQSSADSIRGYLAHASVRMEPNNNNTDIVSVVEEKDPATSELISSTVDLSLTPIGDVPCCGDHEKQPRGFKWTVMRFHVRKPTAGAQKDSLYNLSQETNSNHPTRFCPGLEVLLPEVLVEDLGLMIKKNEEKYSFLKKRVELLQIYMKTFVIPKLATIDDKQH
jgi:hypothetical protein